MQIKNSDLSRNMKAAIYFVMRIIVLVSRCFWPKKNIPSPQKILVVKTHAIGDVLLVTPSIVALRHMFPQAQIHALVGNWSRAALTNNPHLEKLICFDDDILFKFRVVKIINLIQRIHRENYDWAFIFQPSLSIQLLISLAGIPFRAGFDNKGSGATLNKQVPWKIKEDQYIAQSFLELAVAVGARPVQMDLEFYLTTQEIDFADTFFQTHRSVLDPDKTIIGLCPGGGVNPRDRVIAKLWHIDNYVALVQQLMRRIDARFILFGSHEDQAYIQRLIRYVGPAQDNIVNACMKTNLKEMGALLKRCHLVITNDSAPLHIAVALGVPSLSIFGPTNHLSLLPDNPAHIAIQSSVACSPCYHNSPFPGCVHVKCMETITVDKVVEQALTHLERIHDQYHHSGI